jgi:hypothetical protein
VSPKEKACDASALELDSECFWYGFECLGCPGGAVLDVRLDGPRRSPPAVGCPVCGTPMVFKAAWAAGPGGYGSRGDAAGRELDAPAGSPPVQPAPLDSGSPSSGSDVIRPTGPEPKL